MANIEQTIRTLVDGAAPVTAAARPFRLFLKWLGVTLVSTAVIVAFMAPRDDLAAQLASPLFLAEVSSLFALIITTAIAAIWLCFPDLRQKPWVVFLPLLPLAIFIGLSAYRLMHPELTAIAPPEKTHGIDCMLCITALSAVPGLWMFHIVRRNATTHPIAAGAVSFLAASSIGLFMLKFIESNDSVIHLLQSHISAMAILAVIGGFIGRKYLSW